MALDLLIHTATEAVVATLAVEAANGQPFGDYLAHDPDKRALQIALARTLHDFTQRHPTWIRDLLSGSALTGAAAQTMKHLLHNAPSPDSTALAETWVAHWTHAVEQDKTPTAATVAPIAADFVRLFTEHLSAQPFLWATLTNTHQHPASHAVPLNTELAIAFGVFEAALREENIPLRFIGEQEVHTLEAALRVPEAGEN